MAQISLDIFVIEQLLNLWILNQPILRLTDVVQIVEILLQLPFHCFVTIEVAGYAFSHLALR